MIRGIKIFFQEGEAKDCSNSMQWKIKISLKCLQNAYSPWIIACNAFQMQNSPNNQCLKCLQNANFPKESLWYAAKDMSFRKQVALIWKYGIAAYNQTQNKHGNCRHKSYPLKRIKKHWRTRLRSRPNYPMMITIPNLAMPPIDEWIHVWDVTQKV